MQAPRTRPLPCRRAPSLFFALLLMLTLSPSVADACAWPFEWRPGWVPGDPMDEVLALDTWLPSVAPGLFVAIDPVTRRPVAPSIEQRREFERAVSMDALLAPTAPVRVEALPGGGEIVHLNGAFQSFSIARRDASGRFVTDCAHDAETARRLLATPLPSVPAKEER